VSQRQFTEGATDGDVTAILPGAAYQAVGSRHSDGAGIPGIREDLPGADPAAADDIPADINAADAGVAGDDAAAIGGLAGVASHEIPADYAAHDRHTVEHMPADGT